MPLQATSGGGSLGFLKTVPKVLTGLKAVVMLALFRIFFIRSDTPFTYGMVAKPFRGSGLSSGLRGAVGVA